jgi:hypothetical protein
MANGTRRLTFGRGRVKEGWKSFQGSAMAHSTQSSKALKACLLAIAFITAYVPAVSAQSSAAQSFRELLDHSEKECKGLMFYVKGQTIPGIVVKVGADTVEVRNQTYGRVIIRLDIIDAVALNES